MSDPAGYEFTPEPLHWVSAPISAPRTMLVNVPFSNFGETIVIMDRYGNITIKVEQNE